jgi:hypothetical protein
MFSRQNQKQECDSLKEILPWRPFTKSLGIDFACFSLGYALKHRCSKKLDLPD